MSGPSATTATSTTSSRSRTRFRKAIVDALKLKLLPEEKKAIEQRGTTSAEAYNLYLLARQYWVTGNHGDIRREERVMRICERGGRARPLLRAGLGAARDRPVEPALRLRLRGRRRGRGRPCRTVDRSRRSPRRTARWSGGSRNAALHAEADAEMERRCGSIPNSWDVNKEAARVYMRLRRVEEATRHFEKAVGADGNRRPRLGACWSPAIVRWAIRRACRQAAEMVGGAGRAGPGARTRATARR